MTFLRGSNRGTETISDIRGKLHLKIDSQNTLKTFIQKKKRLLRKVPVPQVMKRSRKCASVTRPGRTTSGQKFLKTTCSYLLQFSKLWPMALKPDSILLSLTWYDTWWFPQRLKECILSSLKAQRSKHIFHTDSIGTCLRQDLMNPKLASNFWYSCLQFPSAGITAICYNIHFHRWWWY